MRVIDAEPDAPRRYTVAMAVAGPAHWAHVKWYIRAFGMRGRAAVALRGDANVVAGDTVLTCQKPLLDAIRGGHPTHELRIWKHCSLIQVNS